MEISFKMPVKNWATNDPAILNWLKHNSMSFGNEFSSEKCEAAFIRGGGGGGALLE